MVYVLVGAIGAAAVIGGVRSMSNPGSPAARPEPVAAAPAPEQAAAAQPSEGSGDSVSGEVLELIDVPNYSYIRVGKKGTEGVWAAVPTSKIAVGAPARVVGAMKMSNFQSTALKRTFPEIYFGTLAGQAAGHATTPPSGPNPHGGDGADPHASGADPHASGAAPQGANPHQGQEMPAAGAVEVKSAPKATGPDGRTIGEVYAQRAQLGGKTVRVRGTVVKATNGVMGKNYVHLRDGSGDASAQTNDLTITTADDCKVGDVVMLEGKLATDIDIGSGYKFPTILQEAKIVK
jgi:hypothetical protein